MQMFRTVLQTFGGHHHGIAAALLCQMSRSLPSVDRENAAKIGRRGLAQMVLCYANPDAPIELAQWLLDVHGSGHDGGLFR